MSNIHWFPGHMNRALREIAEKASLVDLVVELRDARAVTSSANQDLITALKNRRRLIVLTKNDLSDQSVTKRWIAHFAKNDVKAIAVNLLLAKDIVRLVKEISSCDAEKRLKEATRGMKPQPLRIMVVGVPNVGKSTLINKLAKRKVAQVENRPGKTKAQQWIKVGNAFELLDTPGILPMHFDRPELAINLALLGMVKEKLLPQEELAMKIIALLKKDYPNVLQDYYHIDGVVNKAERVILRDIATRSGSLIGGEPDLGRAIMMLLSDFRNGRLVHLSLETV